MPSVSDIVDAVRGLARGVGQGINAVPSLIQDGSSLVSSQLDKMGQNGFSINMMDGFSRSFHEKLTETTNGVLRNQFLKYPFDLGSNREYTNVVRFSIHDTISGSFKSANMSPVVQSLLVSSASGARSGALAAGFSVDTANSVAEVAGDSIRTGNEVLGQLSQGFNYNPSSANDPKGGVGLQRARVGFNRNTSVNPDQVVYLYCPPEIKVNYGHGYESTDFSSLNALMLPTSGNNDSLSAYAKYMSMSNVKSLQGVLPDILRPEGETLRGYFEGATRSIVNPLLVNRFTGTDRRTFAFEYVFYPKSMDEVQSCYDIIRAFKKYSHPTRASDDRFLNYPSEFWIEILDGQTLERNPFYPGIVWCCLKKVGVSYGEAVTQASLKPMQDSDTKTWGSPPTKIMLSLEFEELEILTRNRINVEGGNC